MSTITNDESYFYEKSLWINKPCFYISNQYNIGKKKEETDEPKSD